MRLTTRVWNRLPARFLLALTAMSALPAALPAGPVTFTQNFGTGNIITGDFQIKPNLTTPNDTLPASLDVTFGLQNGVEFTIDVFVNGTSVGSMLADGSNAVVFPGPAVATFDVTGLLNDTNTILFKGNADKFLGTLQEYVIVQVDIRYDDSGNPIRPPIGPDAVSAPEPATIWLLGAGSVVALGYARRRRAARHG